MLRIGIDLGGSKIEIVALADDGSELLRRRIAAPHGDYMDTVMAIAGLVEAAESELGQRGSVGVGIPGVESRASGLIKNANSTWLIGQPLRRDLRALLQRDVRLANDANCFALAEAVDGAAAGAAVVFGVILGTGVGGGLVVDGTVLVGANAIAGEWGHNRLPGDEAFWPACYCGRAGCVETFLSGPGLQADHARAAGDEAVTAAEVLALSAAGRDTLASAAAAADGEGRGSAASAAPVAPIAPAEIAARAAAGDAACEATLQRYEARLARGLAQVINIVDPDVIVLGGGLSNLDRLYAHVPLRWGEHIFSDHVATRLLKNRHGDSAGVRGAAWLW